MGMTTPTMAIFDIVFLTCGAVILFVLHAIHPGGHDDHAEAAAEDDHEYHPHTGLYLGIFGALAGLTLVELAAPDLLYGVFYFMVLVLMGLAFMKAGLVGWFFMHLKDEHWSVYLILTLSVIGIMLMIGPITWDVYEIYGFHG